MLQEQRDNACLADTDLRALPLDKVRTMPTVFQPRMEAVSEKHVGDLRSALRNLDDLTPILVLPVDDHVVVIDGHHRLEAYQMEGREEIPVEFFGGTVQDALLRSGSANSCVTLPLTLEQRVNFAWRLVVLRDPQRQPPWLFSRRDIVRSASVSQGTVAAMRRTANSLGEDADEITTWRAAQEALARQEPGKPFQPFGEEELEERAQEIADRLARSLGTQRAQHHEIMARGLTKFLGRNTPQVIMEMIERCETDPALAKYVPGLRERPGWDDPNAYY
ncbi:ParB/RepB/Spo0J family partition protein [Zhengella sp. ZM62]|uniref:ParB/RepB/Spo0J family partition protein n=1 Tax=Zhengella sedimenti TaxID=3390035 RepID=UPI0039764373